MPKISRSTTVATLIVLTLVFGFSDYSVSPGDTLSEIADAHDVTLDQLIKANSLKNPNLIRVGQLLVIPNSSGGDAESVTHVVASGDSLGKIAAKYGVTVAELMDINGITNPDRIYVGSSIVVSGEAAPSVNLASGTTDLTHVVASGDSLGRIAAKYSTTISALLGANSISNPNLITIGQEITVPSATGWRCPVPQGQFINDWGFPRSGGRTHKGTDIFAARGAVVVAPVSGRAEQIEGTIGGLQVRLWGSDGHVYWLTHLSGFAKGEQVNAGDIIGYVGDSGNAVGSKPHVHFEIHIDNGPSSNPFPTLQDACS